LLFSSFGSVGDSLVLLKLFDARLFSHDFVYVVVSRAVAVAAVRAAVFASGADATAASRNRTLPPAASTASASAPARIAITAFIFI
jgi:hypothetical protein